MPAAHPLLDCDPAGLRSVFGREPLVFQHRLAERPELRRDAVVALAADIPPYWLSPVRGELPLVMPDGLPGEGIEGADAARHIDDVCCRLVFHYLERLEPYRRLLFDSLDEVANTIGALEGGLARREAHIFLVSPGSVAPVHYDRHHKVLFQIEGTKELVLGSFADPTVERAEVERSYLVGHNYAGAVPTMTRTYRLEPGDALYLPPYRFHWVAAEPGVSIAFSSGFSTPRTEQIELVHRCNARLRRLRLPARPPGRSARGDRVKAGVIRQGARIRNRIRVSSG